MRTLAKVFAMAACATLIGAPMAIASDANDVSDELAEMRVLVEQMQGQLEAQSEQIDHQGEVIREARLDRAEQSDDRFGASGITAFLQRLQVDGHVSASYFWNFNSPGPHRSVGGPAGSVGGNTGLSGNTYPFHGNHNSFQVDQVWFGLEHPVSEEYRAGFRFDMLFGTTACTMGNAVPTRCGQGNSGEFYPSHGFGDNTSQYYVNQAYIQYLAPITENGILVKAGKFATIVGAEVAQDTANFNITRGNVYNMLQPIDHVGVLASTDFGDTGFSGAFGVINDGGNGFFGTGDPDRNEPKSILAQLGWANDTVSITNTVIWGYPLWFEDYEDDYRDEDDHDVGLYDLVLTWDPTEKISTWINFNYMWGEGQRDYADFHAWGLAMAGRYAVTERLGIASRFEVVRTDNDMAWEDGSCDWAYGCIFPGSGGESVDVNNGTIYSITGTVDYALTNNLTARAEVRYDNVTKDGNDNEFFDQGGDLRPDQTTAGVQLVYEF
jgi:hypothetical protein